MYGLDYVALRYFNVYGPRMDIHGVYTEVLIRWMERIASGRPPLILGDGRQTMDFVHVADVARANLLAAAADDVTDEAFNVATRPEISLAQLAQTLLEAMDADLPVEHGPARAVNGVVRRLADTSRARDRLGFCAEVESGGRASEPGRLVAGRAKEVARRMRRDPSHAAVVRRGGGRRGRGRAQLRLGGAGTEGHRFRGVGGRGARSGACGRDHLLHHCAASGAACARRRARRRGCRALSVVHRHDQRCRATSAPGPSSPTSTSRRRT